MRRQRASDHEIAAIAARHGGVVAREGRWWAAVRACGDAAVLSHASAAAAWDVSGTAGAVVDVTVPGASGGRRREGIRLHRSQTLCPDDVTFRREIPITTPLRTRAGGRAARSRRGRARC